MEFNRSELRKIFSAAEIDVPKDVIGQICELHTESTDGMADSIKDLKKKLKTAEQERDEALEKAPKDGEETVSKADYDRLNAQFETYKNEQSAKEAKYAKEKAAKAFFEGKDIKGGNLDIAMMAASGVIDGLELDGDNFKDTKALDDLVTGKLSSLATTQQTQGANTQKPPANNGVSAPSSLAGALHQKYNTKG